MKLGKALRLACGATASITARGGIMLNTTYPYMQSSANQFIEVLNHIIEVYSNVVLVVGLLLLILLVWLCASELQRSKQGKRVKHQPPTRQPRPAIKRNAVRKLLEESSI
jgi:hypothetical protein